MTALPHHAAWADPVEALADLVGDGQVVVLSGAGLSTESGIPDYRGPTGAARPATPMTFQAFTGSPGAQQRYWARSHLGWRRIARAQANDGHRAVTALQRLGLLSGVLTQNVDGLHTRAGTRDVVELHGNLDRVVCLACAEVTPRTHLHERLAAANPGWVAVDGGVKPDGDVDLADDAVERFTVVGCATCGGALKPDVVFFGESVPPARVARAMELVDGAGALLVLGSSLTVMSGFRFVLRAKRTGVPVAVVNQGPTRADDRADLLVDAALGRVLPALVEPARGVSPGRPGLSAGRGGAARPGSPASDRPARSGSRLR